MAVTCTRENVLIRIRSGDKAKIDVVTSSYVFFSSYEITKTTNITLLQKPSKASIA
jgi:hypothetical protein